MIYMIAFVVIVSDMHPMSGEHYNCHCNVVIDRATLVHIQIETTFDNDNIICFMFKIGIILTHLIYKQISNFMISNSTHILLNVYSNCTRICSVIDQTLSHVIKYCITCMN